MFPVVSHLPLPTRYLDDVGVGPALVRLVVLGVLEQDLVHVGAGVLEQLVGVVEDDEGDLAVAQDAQLVRLLHQAELSLGERHLEERGEKNYTTDPFLHLSSVSGGFISPF